tara:strand:- start:176 stop:523 length:348 start_codon:yes stop_codon:yes gene_type:complete
MFDKLGTLTLVTAPSMIVPDEISFSLINLEEKEKNQFTESINEIFPKDNIVVFIYNETGNDAWLQKAISRSNYVLMDKHRSPSWISDLSPESKTYDISEQQSIQEVFETIRRSNN